MSTDDLKSTAWDLRNDARLDPAIRPTALTKAASAQGATVFLTGATGFIGAHLVAALVQRGVSRVLCLVRANDPAEARARVLANLRKFGTGHADAEAAVEAVQGDLAAPYFGLSSSEFAALGARCDAIIHNGAWVHLGQPYEVLRPTNVWGTREAIKLAVTGGSKPFCHISGVSVFLDAPSMAEDAPPHHVEQSHGGYFDSKWVAERLAWEAYERGLPGMAIRLGWISGDSKHGLIADSDAMTMFIRACARIGCAPRMPVGHFECTPVDVTARLIATAALDSSTTSHGCNLWCSHSFSDDEFWPRFGVEGSPVEVVTADEWVKQIEKRFPLLLPAASTILRRWNYPPREDAVAQALLRRVGEVPSKDALLSVYVPAWLKRRHGPAREAARERRPV